MNNADLHGAVSAAGQQHYSLRDERSGDNYSNSGSAARVGTFSAFFPSYDCVAGRLPVSVWISVPSRTE